MLYQKQIETRYTVDILVVGGGASGVAAAVSAARMGKKVLLCESNGCFGGAGTSGMVPAFGPFTDGVNVTCSGVGLEIRRNAAKNIPVETYWTGFDAEELKREYDRILTEAGVEFLFFTTLCDVLTDGDAIRCAVFTSRTGVFAVEASVYIDCTGDGNLIALAGGEFELGDNEGNVMPPTLCTQWGDIDLDRYDMGAVPVQLEKAIRDGVFTYEDRHLTGLFPREGGYAGGNIGHIFGTDPLSERSLTDAMVWGRKSMLEYTRFYREYIPGCESIRLTGTAAMLGVRESRRIKCDYMLNVQDFLARADFDDEIGRYNYPVDIHIMNTDSGEMERFKKEYETMRYQPGESYGIPYRSLIPVSFRNALTAGRCMGCDRQMEASIRVMPGCFITGQAAGTAAALAADSGDVRAVPVRSLQAALVNAGAYLREALR
ncbi:MAG: FAD-dependent oxidoreductase [Clostridia bacterium]|nr:FAD-dependent oxidoreductase [Clostridia bacterium]